MKKTKSRAMFFRPIFLSLLLPCAVATAQTLPAAVDIALSGTQAEKANIRLYTLGKTGASEAGGQAIHLPGTVVLPPDAQEIVSVPVAGTVQAVLTPPSQPVRTGQPLLQIYSPQLLQWQREFIQAAAQERLAAEKLKRDTALFADGIIAETRLQESRSAATQSRAVASETAQMLRLAGMSDKTIRALSSTQKLSARLDVTARMDGTVLEYGVVPGQQVEAGAALARLARTDRLWVELSASKQQAVQARLGNRIRFASCPGDEAHVIAVSPQLRADSQTVLIRGELKAPSACLSVNQYLEASLHVDGHAGDSQTVPSAAIIRYEGAHWVFVRTANGFTALPVTVMASSDGSSRIRPATSAMPALIPGTRVAIEGTAMLKGALQGIGMEEEAVPARTELSRNGNE